MMMSLYQEIKCHTAAGHGDIHATTMYVHADKRKLKILDAIGHEATT